LSKRYTDKEPAMTNIFRLLFTALLSLAVAMPAGAEQEPRAYAQAELDQMLAPVALYPDPLLSQVLMAATYPLEVSEAARWSRANPGLQGDDAVRAAQNEDWDPSVKSLLAFPQILARMDENPGWTQALGDAFLAQEPQVMDTVQQLRRRAQAAGNLRSSDQLYVQQQGQTIVLMPPRPEYVYVPYYDPFVVYGPWWWPAYRPVYWAPWPRQYAVRVSVGFFFGNFDWRRRQARVVNVNNYYYRPPQVVSRTVVVERNRWQHDPSHRRGVTYRTPEVRQRFAEFQPRNGTAIRRDEMRRPEERHQVLSRPAEQPRVQQQAPQVQRPVPQVQRPQTERRERAEPRQERREHREQERQQAQQSSAPQVQRQAPVVQPQTQRPAAQAQRPPVERKERAERRQERHEDRKQAHEERQESRQAERRGDRAQKGGERS